MVKSSHTALPFGITIWGCREVQGWRSGESTRLPPMWPEFDSQTRRHMWVEFVGSQLCTERFSLGTLVSPILKNQHLTSFVLFVNFNFNTVSPISASVLERLNTYL